MGLISNLVFGRKRAARLRSTRRAALRLFFLQGLFPERLFGFGRVSLLSGAGAAAMLALWQPDAAALSGLGFSGKEPLRAAQTVSRQIPLCGAKARETCVVDGDTLWISGEKIRVADINTPETAQPGCAREKRLGERAKTRLHALVNQGPFQLKREGRDTDRYGRKLRVLVRGGRSLGQQLVNEGLAESWTGRRRDWCA
ncbi:MAG TPA: thermonuclease family protein [Mesorhizobium sp.]|jgi:endonuclease YncB( thermonuclease family)|nr:thermonuclease family protein [Mesorhizobium sp.]